MSTHTYNSSLVKISFRNVLLGGYVDGDFLSIEQNAEDWTLTVGADGESARAASNNASGRVTLSLQATSASNDVLSAFRNEDKLTGNGKGPLMIKDLSGRTVAFAADAWIVGAPSAAFGRDVGTREWVFESGDLSVQIGGN